jgi:hypothetical protein
MVKNFFQLALPGDEAGEIGEPLVAAALDLGGWIKNAPANATSAPSSSRLRWWRRLEH